MLRFLLATILLLPVVSTGQGLLDTLAVEVCDCMTTAPEIVYPRVQATNCVTVVATAHAVRIRAELQLSAADAGDRQQLGGLLVDRLTADCPILLGLGPGTVEPELHYNDIALAEDDVAISLPKNPPPDSLETTAREGRELYQTEGTYAGMTPDRELLLRLHSGEYLTFLARPRQLRRLPLRPGQAVRVVYRYYWRGGGEIRRQLLTVE
ncbi:hypothetical protein [Lewinella sp. JB7]|uniref:hypothetical protein n=1 Tax=Lewinella sp. JB7 TaxID=2962887 RepID=UPI0020C9C047|nr:hypothetical protein [Lewinella sp. JB7]MCP9234808.1 hypothetical protein [Lewinella sp. JB7]